jgi:flagellar hook-associated protein 2
MGTTSSSSAIFTGSSQFSQDFQNVIDRAVAIASLPISQLNDDVTALQAQSKDLSGIDSKVASLQTAVSGIDQVLSSSFQATVSNPALVSATAGNGAVEGNYTIEVDDIGAYATSMSAAPWVNQPNPAGQRHTYQLYVGAQEYDITPDDNSAGSVAAAINAVAGSQVRAAVVNVGSSTTPDYRISLQSTVLGDIPLDIKDNGASLQTQQSQGRLAQYIVNGSGITISSDSRSVNISDGLSVSLLSSSPGNPVNITVTRSTSGLSGALSSFADAYNAVVDALDAQRGQSKGSLNGQSIIRDLQQSLSAIATYSSSGSSAGGLAALGLDLGDDGKFTFNAFTLLSADIANSSGITDLLGSAAGGGFLQSAANAMTALEDPTTGLVKTAEASINSQITSTNGEIATKQDQVNQLQERLTEQMAAADAAIAAMEQQYSYISSMFQAMQTADQQYK